MRLHPYRSLALLAGAIACGSPRDGVAPAAAPPAGELAAPVDYLVVGPRPLLDAARPLIALRTRLGHGVQTVAVEGLASPEAVRDRVAAIAEARPTLRYLLLLGDPAATPSFTLTASDGIRFHSDHAFALPAREPPLAVGRIPARTPTELAAAVDKIVRYETGPVQGGWARRISVFAGPANFGPVADAFLERAVTGILESVPYDFDIQVTFAKAESPYAYAFDRLTVKIAEELSAGALVAVYTGHGSERALDTVYWRGQYYSIGDTEGLAGVRIPEGNPFFISLTCLTGAFGNPVQRSLAEEMVLNPSGPVAAFAASARSHPLANVSLGHGFLSHLFLHRVGTVGEAVRESKRALDRPSVSGLSFLTDGDDGDMWQENAAMYNLFGDPATRLRYPDGAEVVPGALTAAPGARQRVKVSAPAIAAGRVTVTLETERSRLRDGIVAADQLEALDRDAALAAMTANNQRANDRVVARVQAALSGGRAEVELVMPPEPGRYAIKALVEGGGRVAAGSAWVEVAAGP